MDYWVTHASGAIGPRSRFHLYTNGPITATQLRMLVRKLEFDIQLLLEDEALTETSNPSKPDEEPSLPTDISDR